MIRTTYKCLNAGLLLALLLAFVTPLAHAADNDLEQMLVDFLHGQTADIDGDVHVSVDMPDVKMTACRSPRPFLPGRNTRLAGNLTVGVRCPGDRPATRYFRARVSVTTPYYVAARALMPGAVITAADLQRETGDLARLPRYVVTRPDALVGKAVTRRVSAGRPIGDNMVEAPVAVERGEHVRIVATGPGYSITTEGKALNAGPLGGAVRVSTQDGTVVSGTITDENTVTLNR